MAATAKNPNRLQHYYQYQVLIKPSPPDLQDLYLGSLAAIGIDLDIHDIRFVEDDWESPHAWRMGPWLGGLVRRDGGQPSSPISSRSAAMTAIPSRAS